MPYIGRDQRKVIIKIDDLQSSFNGTTFNLTTGGNAFTPGSSNALLVFGGVIQNQSNRIRSQMTRLRSRIHLKLTYLYHCTGAAVSIGTPAEGTVTATVDPNTYSGVGGFTMTGIISATEIHGDGRYLTGASKW